MHSSCSRWRLTLGCSTMYLSHSLWPVTTLSYHCVWVPALRTGLIAFSKCPSLWERDKKGATWDQLCCPPRGSLPFRFNLCGKYNFWRGICWYESHVWIYRDDRKHASLLFKDIVNKKNKHGSHCPYLCECVSDEYTMLCSRQ